MYHPELEKVYELAEHGNLVPIWRELPADLETPVSVYLKLRGEGASFLLERQYRNTLAPEHTAIIDLPCQHMHSERQINRLAQLVSLCIGHSIDKQPPLAWQRLEMNSAGQQY